MTTWYLVRHGETEWNSVKRMQGQMDSRLSESGRRHAGESGQLLARLGFDHAYASPLGRVRETVGLMAPHCGLSPVFDDRLMEWSSGDWSGSLYSEIARDRPDEWAAWDADRYNWRPPNGENFVDLATRARSFIDEITPSVSGRVAIVAHGFINRALAGELMGLAPADRMKISQSNDTVMRITLGSDGAFAEHFVAGQGPFPGLPDGSRRGQTSV
jgi:broad specificity phosphatase PhoE